MGIFDRKAVKRVAKTSRGKPHHNRPHITYPDGSPPVEPRTPEQRAEAKRERRKSIAAAAERLRELNLEHDKEQRGRQDAKAKTRRRGKYRLRKLPPPSAPAVDLHEPLETREGLLGGDYPP